MKLIKWNKCCQTNNKLFVALRQSSIIRHAIYLMFFTCYFYLTSCENNDYPVPPKHHYNQIISSKYIVSKSDINNSILQTMHIMGAPNNRTSIEITGNDLVNFVSSLPKEYVDSLYLIYCNPDNELQYEDYLDDIDLGLVKETSESDVDQLYTFINSYKEVGGNNMQMLETACYKKPLIIQECMISCAAIIDTFSLDYPISRNANSWCLHELTLKLMESIIEGKIADIAIDFIPGANVIGACVMAGMDLYSAIKTAHEYEMCCVTHVS